MKKILKLTFVFLVTLSLNSIHASEEIRVETCGASLYCKTMGKGSPIIVIHGGPGLSQNYFFPFMEKLAENNFVIFYDQRGCGKSTGTLDAKSINTEVYLKDLDAIRQAFCIDKVSLLGHSWGGYLATQYAIHYPEQVEKIILSNSMPSNSDDLALFLNEYVSRTSSISDQLNELHDSNEYSEGDPDTHEKFLRLLFSKYCYHPEKVNLLNLKNSKKAFSNGSRVSELLQKSVFFQPYNFSDELNLLEVPTLVIHGDHDIIPPVTAENTHNCILQSKFVLMDLCGHFPFVEDPDNYFRLIDEFLR